MRKPVSARICCPCGHKGTIVAAPSSRPLKLRCSKCGRRDAVILPRQKMPAWAKQLRVAGATMH
jgi:hypothetical protein